MTNLAAPRSIASTTKKTLLALLAVSTLGVSMLSVTSAEARPLHRPHRHHGHYWGVGAAGAAIGLLGAAMIANSGPAYAEEAYVVPARRCSAEPRYNAYGEYIGTRRVCYRAAY